MRRSRSWRAQTKNPHRILPRAVEEWGERYGEKPALISARETLSFADLARRKTVYARWALERGFAKGEAVALMMRNRPDYFALWLGLCEVGVVAALVSPDLAAAALAHALKVSRAKLLIVRSRLARRRARGGDRDLAARRRRLVAGGAEGYFGDAPLGENERREVTLDDRALRIFTSGTTGMPKAAEVSHRRIVMWSHWFAGLAGFGADDRHYNCLPMHHSVGGVVALGAPLVRGGAVVIAERFSASRFFDDIVRWQCTSFQYIGELCRRLIATPPSEAEKHHQLRLALGNGVAPDVWRAMRERFGDLRVLEFYASTEGNVWLYNVEGRIGALGRVPPYLAARDTIALVRFDPDAQAPLRGEDGFCARCGDDEIGEALGRIGDEPQQRFEGYSEGRETEKKILRNVFKHGRRVDAHRRSDAPRRRRFLLFCRPHRRHLSLEGRKRRDPRSRQGLSGAGRRRGRAGLWRRGPRRGGPRRHGADQDCAARSILRALRAAWRSCRAMRARCSCA